MSLTNDSRKAYEQMLAMLFPSHPYGTQTVLGTQTHLKNPSITNIKAYHDNGMCPTIWPSSFRATSIPMRPWT